MCPEYLAVLTEILKLIYRCKKIEKLNICIFPNIHLSKKKKKKKIIIIIIKKIIVFHAGGRGKG